MTLTFSSAVLLSSWLRLISFSFKYREKVVSSGTRELLPFLLFFDFFEFVSSFQSRLTMVYVGSSTVNLVP